MRILIIWEVIPEQLKIYKQDIYDQNLINDLKMSHGGLLNVINEKPEVEQALLRVSEHLTHCIPSYETDGDVVPLEFTADDFPELVIHCGQIL
jgi:hypothetical protein